jgi:hypothetical protein
LKPSATFWEANFQRLSYIAKGNFATVSSNFREGKNPGKKLYFKFLSQTLK